MDGHEADPCSGPIPGAPTEGGPRCFVNEGGFHEPRIPQQEIRDETTRSSRSRGLPMFLSHKLRSQGRPGSSRLGGPASSADVVAKGWNHHFLSRHSRDLSATSRHRGRFKAGAGHPGEGPVPTCGCRSRSAGKETTIPVPPASCLGSPCGTGKGILEAKQAGLGHSPFGAGHTGGCPQRGRLFEPGLRLENERVSEQGAGVCQKGRDPFPGATGKTQGSLFARSRPVQGNGGFAKDGALSAEGGQDLFTSLRVCFHE